jgi:hypothetical protein
MRLPQPKPLPTPEEMERLMALADALPPDTIYRKGMLAPGGPTGEPIAATPWTVEEIEAELELAAQND